MSTAAIVLAAGKGTRMKSDMPKPLHQARGRSLLGWVITALDPDRFRSVVLVVGHGRDLVVESMADDFADREFVYAEQLAQRGTGDAAAIGLVELDLADSSFADDDHVVVLPGDTPLLTRELVDGALDHHRSTGVAATVVTAVIDDPTGYGRIIRTSSGAVQAIVEHRDATEEQRRVSEVNSAIYCFRRSLLAPALRMISTDNSQGELYLTDVIGVLVEAGHQVAPYTVDATLTAGVNDRAQLADVSSVLGERIVSAALRSGVSIIQPSSTVIEADVSIEPDVTIWPGCTLAGRTTVGAGAVIGPNTHLDDATIGAGAVIEASTVRGCTVDADVHLGPYASLVEGESRADR